MSDDPNFFSIQAEEMTTNTDSNAIDENNHSNNNDWKQINDLVS